jgi:Brp/Blh family beta-carotene 15,15'-monooxygenase
MTWRINATPETWLFLGVGGFSLLLAHQDAFALSRPTLALLLAAAVMLTGIPHGALDPWVAWRAGLWRTRAGFAAFNLAYAGIAVAVLVVWQLVPGASLAIFLAISAWHFGGDWRHELNVWARAACGLALLALPALGAPTEVSAIFAVLGGDEGRVLASWLSMAAPWLATAAAASALVALQRSPAAAVELGAAVAFALLLPPLIFFLVYFCALHSPRHLRIAARSADPSQRRQMAGVALIYTLSTLAAAALVWPWLAGVAAPAAVPEANLIRLLFIGLAALTLPHMIVIMLSEQSGQTLP